MSEAKLPADELHFYDDSPEATAGRKRALELIAANIGATNLQDGQERDKFASEVVAGVLTGKTPNEVIALVTALGFYGAAFARLAAGGDWAEVDLNATEGDDAVLELLKMMEAKA